MKDRKSQEEMIMETIAVHKFITLDGSLTRRAGPSTTRSTPRALLEDGLADKRHLFVFPPTLGSGQRLFADGAQGSLP